MKVNILDVEIDNLSKSTVLQKVRGFLSDGGQHTIFTPNPEMLVLASRNKQFRDILNSADILAPDGFGLILASWFLKTPFVERITGIELVQDISRIAIEEGKKIFLFGGALGVAKAAGKKLTTSYKSRQGRGFSMKSELQATSPGWIDGIKVDPNHLDKVVIQKINDAKPDVLFVALGHGKQEKFIHRYLRELPSVKVAIGVGGALNFIAGNVRRAPKLLQKIGFEWLWRLMIEPWRLSRIINAVFTFPIKVFLWKR